MQLVLEDNNDTAENITGRYIANSFDIGEVILQTLTVLPQGLSNIWGRRMQRRWMSQAPPRGEGCVRLPPGCWPGHSAIGGTVDGHARPHHLKMRMKAKAFQIWPLFPIALDSGGNTRQQQTAQEEPLRENKKMHLRTVCEISMGVQARGVGCSCERHTALYRGGLHRSTHTTKENNVDTHTEREKNTAGSCYTTSSF